MRRILGLAVASLVVSLVGCSSGDSMAVEFTINGFQDDVMSFSASGVAVDEAAVCESGTMKVDHLESPEGETITSEEGAALQEAARADQGTMDLYRVHEFVCDDGSGTFTTKDHHRADFAKSESQQDIPTWEIENGTGDYADLSGSGEFTTDFPAAGGAVSVYIGELKTG